MIGNEDLEESFDSDQSQKDFDGAILNVSTKENPKVDLGRIGTKRKLRE